MECASSRPLGAHLGRCGSLSGAFDSANCPTPRYSNLNLSTGYYQAPPQVSNSLRKEGSRWIERQPGGLKFHYGPSGVDWLNFTNADWLSMTLDDWLALDLVGSGDEDGVSRRANSVRTP